VAAKTLTLRAAAELMDVRYRQAKRLYGRYRARGERVEALDRWARVGSGGTRTAPSSVPGTDPSQCSQF